MGVPGHLIAADEPASTLENTDSAQARSKDAEWPPAIAVIPLLPLERGLVALVDFSDFETLAEYEWYPAKSGRNTYAFRWDGRVYMHRQILGLIKSESADHTNGDGLDNRRCNLRKATASQNMANRRKRRDGCSSRFKGVNRRTASCVTNPWAAVLCGQYLGYFQTEEAAAKAYDAAATEKYGEFARINFPSEPIQ